MPMSSAMVVASGGRAEAETAYAVIVSKIAKTAKRPERTDSTPQSMPLDSDTSAAASGFAEEFSTVDSLNVLTPGRLSGIDKVVR